MANEELTGKIAAASQDATDAWVILVDERGPFATRKSRLDTGWRTRTASDNNCRDKVVKDLTPA